MTTPLISIVIPTRNRPKLVSETLSSIAQCEYSVRYEVIISDNSDLGQDYSGPLHGAYYFKHPRRLTMAENWQFACEQARGEWLLILPDKSRLCKDALRRLKDLATLSPWLLITWRIRWWEDRYCEPETPAVIAKTFTDIESYNSLFKLNFFKHDIFPHGYNMMFRRDALKPGLFDGTCPDYTAGINLLKYFNNYHTFLPITYISPRHKPDYSNGMQTALGIKTEHMTDVESRYNGLTQDRSFWPNWVLSDIRAHDPGAEQWLRRSTWLWAYAKHKLWRMRYAKRTN